MPVKECILCNSKKLTKVLDLGFHPLADSFLSHEQLHKEETRYPLEVLLCSTCGHVMNSYVVDPSHRYRREYSYDSGNSTVSVNHFETMARDVVKHVGVSQGDRIVDIGSSVGTLLKAFEKHARTQSIGIEPAWNIAKISRKNRIHTIEEFWGKTAADAVLKKGKARVVTATNCFNHIEKPRSFITNVLRVLERDGVFVFEVPYLLPLVQKCAFDTMYLEHISYFAVAPLRKFFGDLGCTIEHVEENEYMGGTIRIFVSRGSKEGASVKEFLAREQTAGLTKISTYIDMATRVHNLKLRLLREVLAIREKGGVVIGIGAAAKGNTLLNYCTLDESTLSFITDASPLKLNKFTPGSHIPILPDSAITPSVTHALILPWNIAEFLTKKLAPKHPKLKFIIPHVERV
jgi:ubiquinone/menaquinone biosynthesis C-methylase UbiE